MVVKRSKEFEERSLLIKLQDIADKKKHERKMIQLEYIRENNKIEHDMKTERQRIKSAEIRKMHDRKELSRMGKWQRN